MLRCVFVVFLSALSCSAQAAEETSYTPTGGLLAVSTFDPLAKPNSLYLFGGAMSTRSFGSTMRFDSDYKVGPNYDNFIVGLAYERSLQRLGYGFTFGIEAGIADRFGHYAICCNLVSKSDILLHSPEFWAGPRISFDGVVLANTIRVSGALTVGFSVTTQSIGRERQAEVAWTGTAGFLGYVGPELSLSLVEHPEWQLVYRVQHRSGANGTFGNIREGYNANTLGVRHSF